MMEALVEEPLVEEPLVEKSAVRPEVAIRTSMGFQEQEPIRSGSGACRCCGCRGYRNGTGGICGDCGHGYSQHR